MLESNPPRNNQVETHPNDGERRRLMVGASVVWIDFPMPLKNSSREGAASGFLDGQHRTAIQGRPWILRILGPFVFDRTRRR
jgi:hypothetical protein